MSQKALVVRDLVVGYRRKVAVLNRLNLEIGPGQLVSLLGPNGSGKSTFLHALLGLIPARSGRIDLNGEPMRSIQRTEVGFCADDLPLPDLLTGREFLNLSAVARGVTLTKLDIVNLFEATNMAGSESRMIREYSHGMKRKLLLMANILHSPSLLVMDEPFRGLDPESHQVMLSVIKTTVDLGNIVLFSTHDLAIAAKMSDDVLIIDRGTIRYLGKFSDGQDGAEGLSARFSGIVNSDDQSSTRSEQLFETLARIRMQ